MIYSYERQQFVEVPFSSGNNDKQLLFFVEVLGVGEIASGAWSVQLDIDRPHAVDAVVDVEVDAEEGVEAGAEAGVETGVEAHAEAHAAHELAEPGVNDTGLLR